jgi:hypothetical protein
MEWQITKRTRKCFKCQKPFENKIPFYSALMYELIDKKEQLLRQDYCTACWDPKLTNLFSFWQTALIQLTKPKTAKEVLIGFFDNLINPASNDETPAPDLQSEMRSKAIYLFTLILLRKKILKLKDEVIKDNQTYLIVERYSDNKVYEILNLNIAEDELQTLRDEFSRLFEFEI